MKLKDSVRKCYIETYPEDSDLGEQINNELTFEGLFEALDRRADIYETLGVCDSIVRERCFEMLADIIMVDYDYIYKQWLN